MLELTAGAVVTLFDSPMGFSARPKSILDERTLAVVYVSGDPYTRHYDLDSSPNSAVDRPESIVAVTTTPDAEP